MELAETCKEIQAIFDSDSIFDSGAQMEAGRLVNAARSICGAASSGDRLSARRSAVRELCSAR